MIVHIVKQGETLEKVLEHYHLQKNDVMSENRHISDWQKLVPGTKIKIPLLSEEIFEELEATEPFIEDYYPTVDLASETIKPPKKEPDIIEEKDFNQEKEKQVEAIDNSKQALDDKTVSNKRATSKNCKRCFYPYGYIRKI